MDIKIIDALELVKEKLPGFSDHINAVLDIPASIKLTRCQIQANLLANTETGAYVEEMAIHDKKCEEILAADTDSSILLFPEYCVSYDLIKKHAQDKSLWPIQTTLWVLPCQGIKHDDFVNTLAIMKEYTDVAVIDDCMDYILQKYNFVNALMYCFVVTNASREQKLVLLPQLKTRPMADPNTKCEAYMTLGKLIYKFCKPNGVCLISLLCADTLNSEKLWANLSKTGSTRGLVILHPQLNEKPRHESFSLLRKLMWETDDKSLYVSANWARGTSVKFSDEQQLQIKSPWSCIYHKREKTFNFNTWCKNHAQHLRDNPQKLLYGSYIKNERVSIWYAAHHQLVQNINIQKPTTSSAITLSNHDTIVNSCMLWNGKNWVGFDENETEYRRELYLNEVEHGKPTLSSIAKDVINNPTYEYPFASTTDKVDTDRFIELLICETANAFTHSSEHTEIPKSPLLLVDGENIEDLTNVLMKYMTLIQSISSVGFPPHFQMSNHQEDYKFGISTVNDITYNIESQDKHALVSIQEDENEAAKYLKKLKDTTHKNVSEEHEFPFQVAVLTRNFGLSNSPEYKFIPKLETEITNGDAVENPLDITRGGA